MQNENSSGEDRSKTLEKNRRKVLSRQQLLCYACRGPGPTFECRYCGCRFCCKCMIRPDKCFMCWGHRDENKRAEKMEHPRQRPGQQNQASGQEKSKGTRSKFAVRGSFFQKFKQKHQKWCDKREKFRPKRGPTRKLCDKCGHRPNRRVKCQICKRAVGPCCMATDEPDPLCKDCWAPDPEQTRMKRDDVLQVDGSFSDVDDDDHAKFVSNSSKDEVISTDERATESIENLILGTQRKVKSR